MKASSLIFSALALSAILSAPVSAAVFYLEINQSGTTWRTTADWNSMADGSGSDPTTADFNNAAHIFDTQGRNLRTANDNTAFGAATLLLSSGSGNGMIVRSDSPGNTIANLQTAGGRITSGVSDAVVNVTNFNNSGGVFLKPEDGGARILRLNIGTLTGGGNMSLQNGTGSTASVYLGISTSASSYTGNILFTGNPVNLVLNSSFVSGGGLVLNNSNSRLSLADGMNVTFASVQINTTTFLDPGTYTWAQLQTDYSSTIFTGTSTGTLTVVPEPRMIPLLALAAAGAFIRGRRRR